MEIIRLSAVRNFFNLNVSTRELQKLKRVKNDSISDLTVNRLLKTLDTSRNQSKKVLVKLFLRSKGVKLLCAEDFPSFTGLKGKLEANYGKIMDMKPKLPY